MYSENVTLKLIIITSGLGWMFERFEYVLSRSHIRLHIVLDALVFQIFLNPLHFGVDPLDSLFDDSFHYLHIDFGVFLIISVIFLRKFRGLGKAVTKAVIKIIVFHWV